jgi:ABC-type multidrug transport system fused ATPase/permease subunit
VISSSQRPLRDNKQQTNIHAPGGIRIHDRSRQAAVDLRLRPRGRWDRHSYTLTVTYNQWIICHPILSQFPLSHSITHTHTYDPRKFWDKRRHLKASLSPTDKKPEPSWPSRGAITFEHLHMKYGDDQPNVLKNLNFKIEPTHKVCMYVSSQ